MFNLHRLDHRLYFPSVSRSNAEGIVAFGGDLSPERLLLAYRSGIFPWFDEELPILWWSPDPRFVMRPEEVKVSKSMRPVLRSHFRFTFDRAFDRVIAQCRYTARHDQEGTWITDEMQQAYCRLHHLGHAHSVEVWNNGALVGGLYGVSLGAAYFGESMFSHQNNASKAGFIQLCRTLSYFQFQLVDCQVYTRHLARMGAYNIPRPRFMALLNEALQQPNHQGSWQSWEGVNWFN